MISQDVRDAICELLADGKSLRAACKETGTAARSVLDIVDAEPLFAAQYAAARARGYQRLADEIIEISDDARGDVIETENGPRMDAEFVARSRLRVDTRKWMLSKMLPKVYGEKVTQELTGPDGGALVITMAKGDESL